MDEPTPMMRQYREIKAAHPDTILFFRLGDFYEMFGEDAALASRVLNLTLTRRQTTPMCGIPYHASENYIARLLKAGHRIAICEQVSEPGKGLVQRKVVEVLSPGTVVEDRYLEDRENSWLLGISCRDGDLGLAAVDLSTGEFRVTRLSLVDRLEPLRRELWKYGPREILIPEALEDAYPGVLEILKETQALLNKLPPWYSDFARSEEHLKKVFRVHSLRTLGLPEDGGVETTAAGHILEYLHQGSKGVLDHIRHLSTYSPEDWLILDEATSRNLEIIKNQRDGGRGYTLLEALDKTKTSLGSRRLRNWLLHPLKSRESITTRQNSVGWFVEHEPVLRQVRQTLAPVLDLDRLCARLSLDKAHAKDLLGVKNSLTQVFLLTQDLGEAPFPVPQEALTALGSLVDLLDRSIHPDPSLLLGEGRLIRPGYDEELDRLTELRDHSQGVLDRYLEQERQKSGIPQLKLKYNRVIGWFLEATRLQSQDIPPHFMRKQSLVGAERFTTAELMALESELNRAKEQALEREKTLFLAVRAQTRERIPLIQEAGDFSAEIDALQSLALAAYENNYVAPELVDGLDMEIIEGRHPVVEHYLSGGSFIPNDLAFHSDFRFCLLTGPNMAGKSTYLRQTALITLLAHVGSFVPATRARIGLTDRIFCRVGASDFLARGESTFLVEMNETAHILRNATERSLVIMDEVGRGTSTHDGLAIAWAVSEHILSELRCRTLFATHFHELTLLSHPLLRPFTMAVQESGSEVVFLRKVKEGSAQRSYGIYVAQVAGLPLGVLERAKVLLDQISDQEKLEAGLLTDPRRSLPGGAERTETACLTSNAPVTQAPGPGKEKAGDVPQLDLFSPRELVLTDLLSLDINRMTPLEALNRLALLQNQLK